MDIAAAIGILKSSGWLSQQPADFQALFLRNGILETFQPGEFILHAGEQPGGVYGVVTGSIGAFVPTGDAEIRLAELFRPGIWFGMGPLFTGEPRTLTFKAMTTATLMKVELARLKAMAQTDAVFALALGALSFQAYSVTVRVVRDLLVPDTNRRIASTLLRISGSIDALLSASRSDVRINQDELAELTNVSRNSVNRALRSFEKAGWVTLKYAQIVIREPDALKNFAQGRDF